MPLSRDGGRRAVTEPELVQPDEVDPDLAVGLAWRQLLDEVNLYAGQGAAVGEFIATGHGRADYLLFVDGTRAGAVEAKPSGTPLASPLHCASR